MPQVKVQSVETVEGCTHEVSAVKKHMKNRLVTPNCMYHCWYNSILYSACNYCITEFFSLEKAFEIIESNN